MKDLCDGKMFSTHPLFSIKVNALQVLLYFDELETCNAFCQAQEGTSTNFVLAKPLKYFSINFFSSNQLQNSIVFMPVSHSILFCDLVQFS